MAFLGRNTAERKILRLVTSNIISGIKIPIDKLSNPDKIDCPQILDNTENDLS